MLDMDTFLVTLYVIADDFCNRHFPAEKRPGPEASLSCSEVITLAVFAQWSRFRNQRDFYRFARQKLRSAFPSLPDRSQFNRLMRGHCDAIVAFFLCLVDLLDGRKVPYEILDTSGVPVRNVKRRGHGWLTGMASIGGAGTFDGIVLSGIVAAYLA